MKLFIHLFQVLFFRLFALPSSKDLSHLHHPIQGDKYSHLFPILVLNIIVFTWKNKIMMEEIEDDEYSG